MRPAAPEAAIKLVLAGSYAPTRSDAHIDRRGPRWALSDPWCGLKPLELKKGRLEVSTQ
jgi:hypothetical protein